MGIFKRKAEQRQERRLNDSLVISLQAANQTLKAICQSCDISQGGMRLRLPQELKPNSTLKIWIDLPHPDGQVLVIGKVAWQKEVDEPGHPIEVGIKFTIMDPTVREKLEMHIRKITQA